MEQTFIEILRRALDEELTRDASVYLLGEDVAAGGAFGVTRGLAEKFGAQRVRNTPISEAAITGVATGAALCGLKPVLEIMFIDFATLAMDTLVNQTAKYRYMSGGQLAVPLVVRTQAGAAGGAAAQHSQSLESWFIHVPGLVVLAPSSPAEAYGLLKSAIRLGEPVLFVEHKRLYTMKESLVDGAELPPIGVARIARAGTDVTLIAYSAMVRSALHAAEELSSFGVSAEVIDLRTLVPLDMTTIGESVAKTHRVVIAHEAVLNGGAGAEIAARIGTELFDELDAPVTRVGCPFAPIPFAPVLERALHESRLQPAFRGRAQIGLVRGNHHDLFRAQVQGAGGPEVHPGIGLEELEGVGRENGVPRQPRVLEAGERRRPGAAVMA